MRRYRIFILLILSLAVSLPCVAMSAQEEVQLLDSAYVYQTDEDMAVVRSRAREAAFAALYSRFTVDSGAVRIDIDQSAGVDLKQLLNTYDYGDAAFLHYRVEIQADPNRPAGESQQIRSTVKYPRTDPDIGESRQPAIRILIDAVRKSGSSSGWVRIESISYEGFGTFKALVEVIEQ